MNLNDHRRYNDQRYVTVERQQQQPTRQYNSSIQQQQQHQNNRQIVEQPTERQTIIEKPSGCRLDNEADSDEQYDKSKNNEERSRQNMTDGYERYQYGSSDRPVELVVTRPTNTEPRDDSNRSYYIKMDSTTMVESPKMVASTNVHSS